MNTVNRILAACGNDCSACPRYVLHPYEKSEEELRHTAELWMKIGYRDHMVTNDEISCTGCKPENWCRYRVIKCCQEKEIKTCASCSAYPCETMKECFEVTSSFEPKCLQVCSEAEYAALKRAFFEKKQNLLIEQAISYITDLFRNDSGGHDAEHTLRVYHNAMRIAETEPGCDREITALAALLHDADDHKLFYTENNRNARAFLEGRVPAERIDRICACINAVSFSQNQGKVPETLEGKIVQDADRLDAMGAIGIARTFAYGGEHGRPLKESVQHFHDKLLLLKDMMNTETAKQLAARRHAFLEAFLSELDEELMTTDEVKRYIPYYDEHGRCWRVDFPDRPSEEGDLLYVASEFARTGLYFPYNDAATKEKDYSGHAHYFEGVLRALLDDPEGFSIEGFEEYYSLQEREMLTEVQEHLLRSRKQV